MFSFPQSINDDAGEVYYLSRKKNRTFQVMGTKTLSSILNGTLTFFCTALQYNVLLLLHDSIISRILPFLSFFLFQIFFFSNENALLTYVVHPMHVSLTQVTSKLDPLDTPFLCYYVKCKRHSDLKCILEVIISSSKIEHEMYIWCFYSYTLLI